MSALDRHARAQAADHGEHVHFAPIDVPPEERKRDDDVDFVLGEGEGRRHDTDDRVGLAVEEDGLSDGRGIPLERTRPHCVREDRHTGGAAFSSPSMKSRPSCGRTPSVRKKFADTTPRESRSATSGAV